MRTLSPAENRWEQWLVSMASEQTGRGGKEKTTALRDKSRKIRRSGDGSSLIILILVVLRRA